jgi:cell wall assembly regulator SMI1
MNNLWQRIQNALEAKAAGAVLNDLNPAANPDRIAELTRQFGVQPTEELTSYLRIHDGQDGRFDLIVPWQLLSVESIESEIELMNETFRDREDEEIDAIGPVKPVLWNRAWIPFASDGAGNLLCIDLDPDDGGDDGQVIQWAADPPYVEVIAPSLQGWLEAFALDLERDLYNWNDKDESWSRIKG